MIGRREREEAGPPVTIGFGEFVFDPKRRELLRGDRPVHLTLKAFDLLATLVERRPEVVPKADLEARIWGRTHVAETSLAGLVAEVRQALGDRRRDGRYIRTVHGYGYAFSGATDAGTAHLPRERRAGSRTHAVVHRLAWSRREVSLQPGENILGRDRDVVAWIDSPTVSRHHARVLIDGEEAVLEDLGSRNGTYVGGRRVEGPVRLSDHDEIRLGSVVLTFRTYAAGETESQAD
jgi:DNA-binding winged helix-turn-helix (wHTH) protein